MRRPTNIPGGPPDPGRSADNGGDGPSYGDMSELFKGSEADRPRGASSTSRGEVSSRETERDRAERDQNSREHSSRPSSTAGATPGRTRYESSQLSHRGTSRSPRDRNSPTHNETFDGSRGASDRSSGDRDSNHRSTGGAAARRSTGTHDRGSARGSARTAARADNSESVTGSASPTRTRVLPTQEPVARAGDPHRGARTGTPGRSSHSAHPDSGTPRTRYSKRKLRRPRRRRWIFVGIGAFLVVVLAVVGIYTGIFVSALNGVQRIAIGTQSTGPTQNILLVGNDERPANMTAAEYKELNTTPDGGSNNTDTMIILHIPAGGASATMISLPRDSWVNIPGYGMNKLNAAYTLGAQDGGDAAGAKLLIKTVEGITGLTINHFVKISLIGFYNIAKALGPIQVCLNEATSDSYSGANFVKGEQTLDATQALAFVRQRHNLPLGDLDREIRQQYFLSVEAHKLLSAGTLANPVKLNDALQAIAGSVQVDSGLSLISLADEMKNLTGGNIRSATIPVSGTPTIVVNGQDIDVVELDTAAIPGFFAQITGASDAFTQAKAASPSSVTVTVLNAGAASGSATEATTVLSNAGFKTGTPADTSNSSITLLQYPPGQESGAKAVAALVPGATPEATSSVSGVTLVLGSDGIMPTGTTSGSGAGSSAAATPATTPTAQATSATQSYSSANCID